MIDDCEFHLQTKTCFSTPDLPCLYCALEMTIKKLVLVIGATGAQGLAVIDALLAPNGDGSPSPYSVRALTRDPSSKRAQELAAKGVECVKGISFRRQYLKNDSRDVALKDPLRTKRKFSRH